MIYFLSEINSDGTTAGNKARNDVEKILTRRGYKPINAPTLWKEKRHGNRVLFFLKAMQYLKKIRKVIPYKSTLIVQYPLEVEFKGEEKKLDYTYLFSSLTKYYNIVAVVHDINNLRSNVKKKSTDDLKNARYIISHNKKMTSYPISEGIEENKIINLQIFDYLISKENEENHFKDKEAICFAGNLAKSGFVNNFPNEVKKIGVNLYGNGYNTKQIGVNYKGTFDSETISSVIRGRYGLIWDGNSSETCDGYVGNYLKYNNPHKLSMYIVANMPIMIWDQAAEADFVLKNNIGITVSRLTDIPHEVQKIDEEKYNQMLKSVKKVKRKLVNGCFLNRSLDFIEKEIR